MDGPSLDEFLARRRTDRRLARLTHDVALPVAAGLEFGALDNPTLLPAGLTVEFVDYAADAFTERPGAVRIDHAWTGAGSLAAICGRSAAYDFAIASQVAQYVPNLLGWFRGIHEVLRPGGVLNLSLPDRRFMFDVGRAPSTAGELVEAFYLDLDRPSARQIFDHTHGARAVEPADLWAGEGRAEPHPRLSGDIALDLAHSNARATLEEGRYLTCHCWVFTPLSFLGLIADVTRLGLFPFVISQFSATEPEGYEFYVSLRRDRDENPATLREKQLFAIGHVRDIALRRERIARALARS